ncbi:MAG: hypothetical protein IJ783_08130 [Kiritimatiellae bacterium]|nr:hypothetical protein [Kiritimatiellia bacterium]
MNLTVLLAVLLLAAWTYLASSRGGDSYQNPYVNEIRTALFRPVTAIERLVRPDGSAPPWWLCPALLVAAVVLAGSAAGIILGAGGGSFRAFGAVAGVIVSESLALVAQLSVLRLLLDWRLSGSWGSAPLGFLESVTWPLPEIG